MFQTKTLKRFTVVLTISITGIVASTIFLRPKNLELKNESKKEYAATVIEKKNEVERQRPQQILWQEALPGDSLERGEKIKTTANSTAIVKFMNSKTTLNIEPNSVVVIDQNQDKVALRILAGNLFVKQELNDEKIDVFSGENNDKKIELRNAEAAIGFNKNGADVDVMKGKATSGGIEIKNSTTFFGEIYPNYSENIYYEETNKLPIKMSWTPIADKNYKVSLLLGKSRESLSQDDVISIDQENGFASITPRSNTTYWKLLATHTKTNEVISSSVMKFNSEKIVPPLLVFPSNNDTLRIIPNENNLIDFKWNLFIPLQNIKIEFSQDSSFNKIILNDLVTKQTYYETRNLTEEGRYYWRVQGSLSGLNESITSKTFSFDLIKGKKILGPALTLPENDYIFRLDETGKNNFISLSWKPELDAASYILNLKVNSSKKDISLNNNSHTIDLPSSGVVTWSVQSVDEFGKKSPVREVRTIKIISMSEIFFLKQPAVDLYFIQTLPSMDFVWSKVAEARSYSLLFSKTSQFISHNRQDVQQNNFHYTSSEAGDLYVKVEGLDEERRIVAQSKIIKIRITEKPLPSPPTFDKGTPFSIQSSPEGNVNVLMNQVDKDLKIIAELRSSSDSLIEKQTLENSTAKFNSLLPGKYFIVARISDTHGRLSDYGQKRAIIVPEKSMIKAPKIKNLKIK